jgi:hypothetical protein
MDQQLSVPVGVGTPRRLTASSLFSQKEDRYAFGEMDEVGKQNLASFASGMGDGCLFEFMPVEDRVYFIRKSGGTR